MALPATVVEEQGIREAVVARNEFEGAVEEALRRTLDEALAAVNMASRAAEDALVAAEAAKSTGDLQASLKLQQVPNNAAREIETASLAASQAASAFFKALAANIH
ncbi:hypothetical protein H0H81_005327 [Sphagnurus paluster]|uniref:Uncharacterized protein n=1 Tax=Sphagnurus paluster TaxID=117069 RepID=A0A9P7KL57_9AGAR|nr:hypothetical protein H0H81_005327 [Sphagnurus paluster]